MVAGFGRLVRSNSEPDVSASQPGIVRPRRLPEALGTSIQPLASQQLLTRPPVTSSTSTVDTDSDQPSLKVIVGYVGSIEVPHNSDLPSSQFQSIRSAMRRLQLERKVHTMVLMEVRQDGIRLVKPTGSTVAFYPVSRLTMSGMYPEDERFFGLVTTQVKSAGEDGDTNLGLSCHVFMVKTELVDHSNHLSTATLFGICCTLCPTSNTCLEFPESCAPVVKATADRKSVV